jgi:hypothetical protein
LITLLTYISIIFLQNLAIFLDNLGIFYLIKKSKSNNLASKFAKKHQIDFMSRGFLFFSPPLLGIMLINEAIYAMLSIFLISTIFSFLVSVIQSLFLIKLLKLNITKIKINIFLVIIGILIYSIYMYVPFYLNILSFFFIDHSLWLVQLSPALTMISSIFVVYFLDPKLAKFIDDKKKKSYEIVVEILFIRTLGRLLLFFVSLILFLNYA